MKHRLLQSVCIVLIFLSAFALCLWLGVREGRSDTSLRDEGQDLEQKEPWDTDEIKNPFPSELSLSPEQIVYVSPEGQKFHLYADCTALRRTSQIKGMQCQSALAEGKTLCSRCEKRKQSE